MTRNTDSTGAMAAAWFGTPGAGDAIGRVFDSGRAQATNAGEPVPVPSEMLPALRELRSWHAAQVTQNRGLAKRVACGKLAEAYDAQANQHLRYVQTLNDFFPAGDYCEL